MTCKKCGNKLKEDAQFCVGCGTSMKDLRDNNLLDETDATYVEPKMYGNEEPFVPKSETMLDNTVESKQVLENITTPALEEIAPEGESMPTTESQPLESNPQLDMLNSLNNSVTPIEVPAEQQTAQPKTKKEKKQGRKNPVIIILLVLLILASVGFGIYFKMIGSPKKEVEQLLNYAKNYSLGNKTTEKYDTIGNKITAELIYPDEYGQSVTYNIDVDSFMNYLNKELKFDINLKSDAMNLNGSIIGSDSKLYLKVSGLLEKYISIDCTEAEYKELYESLFEQDTNSESNINTIYTSILSSISKSLKKEYFKEKIVKTTINNDNKYAKEITLTLTPNYQKDYIKRVLNNLQNDNEFIKAVEAMDNSIDVVDYLDGIINSIQTMSFEETYVLKIYKNLFDGKVIKVVFDDYEIEIVNENKIIIKDGTTTYTVELTTTEDITTIKIDSDKYILNLSSINKYNEETEVNAPSPSEVYEEAELEDLISNMLGFTANSASNMDLIYESNEDELQESTILWYKQTKEDKYVITVIAQSWCSHCENIKPIIEEIKKENNIEIYWFDVDLLPATDREAITEIYPYDYQGTPHIFITKNGETISEIAGEHNKKEYVEFLKNNGVL